MDQLIETNHSCHQVGLVKWTSSLKQTTVVIRWDWWNGPAYWLVKLTSSLKQATIIWWDWWNGPAYGNRPQLSSGGTGEMDQLMETDHSCHQVGLVKWISSLKQTTVVIRWDWWNGSAYWNRPQVSSGGNWWNGPAHWNRPQSSSDGMVEMDQLTETDHSHYQVGMVKSQE